jgi:hypothetical protein
MIIQQQLIGDRDFYAVNYGVILGKDSSIKLALSFDKENAFELLTNYYFGFVSETNLDFLKKRFPDVYICLENKIINLLKNDHSGTPFFIRFFEDEMPGVSQMEGVKDVFDLLQENLAYMSKAINQINREMI